MCKARIITDLQVPYANFAAETAGSKYVVVRRMERYAPGRPRMTVQRVRTLSSSDVRDSDRVIAVSRSNSFAYA